jgi:hypothetical protein
MLNQSRGLPTSFVIVHQFDFYYLGNIYYVCKFKWMGVSSDKLEMYPIHLTWLPAHGMAKAHWVLPPCAVLLAAAFH